MRQVPALSNQKGYSFDIGSELKNSSTVGRLFVGGRARLWLRRAATFLLGQCALQAVNAATGFFLLHTLSLQAYAQFGLAFAFQTTANTLTNLGFASTIIPLVAEHTNDRLLIGTYVRAAKRLRNVSFAIILPLTSGAFLLLVHDRGWSPVVQLALLASILITVFFSGPVSYFSAPLFITGCLRRFYVPQTLASAVKLVAASLLYIAGSLSSWSAAFVGALSTTMTAYLLQRESKKLIIWPEKDDPNALREIVKTVLPTTPAILFSAFQSQLSLILVAIFGRTHTIAQVAALSRLGQLFTILITFNTVVIEPHTARVSTEGLARKYVQILCLAIVCCAPLVAFTFLWPTPLLWLLGAKYDSVRHLIGWYVTSSCVAYLAGVIWTINRSRRWLFWRGTWAEVLSMLAVQAFFVWRFGVDTTEKAVFFGLATSCCYLGVHSYVAVYGFSRMRRQGTTDNRAAI